MGYPNFGKVRTLTLPYEEDLTTSQYFDRYGIDLATIDLYDLVNIALDDVVYPVLAIDKENKVLYMADRAFSYNGGLSVANTSLIQEVIEEGSIVNAKPIYCHPITLIRTTGGNMRLTCLIFNNTDTAFTLTTFKQWFESLVDSIGTVRLMVSGGMQSEAQSKYIISASYIAATKESDDYVYVIGGIIDNGAYEEIYGTWDEVFIPANIVFYDNVNKIN